MLISNCALILLFLSFSYCKLINGDNFQGSNTFLVDVSTSGIGQRKAAYQPFSLYIYKISLTKSDLQYFQDLSKLNMTEDEPVVNVMFTIEIMLCPSRNTSSLFPSVNLFFSQRGTEFLNIEDSDYHSSVQGSNRVFFPSEYKCNSS